MASSPVSMIAIQPSLFLIVKWPVFILHEYAWTESESKIRFEITRKGNKSGTTLQMAFPFDYFLGHCCGTRIHVKAICCNTDGR